MHRRTIFLPLVSLFALACCNAPQPTSVLAPETQPPAAAPPEEVAVDETAQSDGEAPAPSARVTAAASGSATTLRAGLAEELTSRIELGTASARIGGGDGLGQVAMGTTQIGSGLGYSGAGGVSRAGAPRQRALADDRDARRENFEHYGFNAWTDANVDALATFSIDVDTASYAIARRDLNAARLPVPESVRVEEFVNAFDYQYALPTGDETPFAVHLEAAPSRFGDELQLLRVGIQGAETHRADRAPANLVFLIDSSGSMSAANKLPLVKYALRALLAGLGPSDTLSIVTYAGSSQVVLPPTPVRDHATISRAIESIMARGGTNGADGIRTAYEVANTALVQGGTNRVIWCSDGDLNVGMRGDELLAFIEENGRSGVALTTLGFGTGNLNDRDLERFANRGDGNYYYIDDRNEALRVLARDMAGTIEVIARDVKIQVEVNPQLVESYRLIGYENRDIADRDFRNDAVDAGEIGSGHSVTAFLELRMRDGSLAAATSELATVRVRYEMPTEEGEGREVESTLRVGDVRPSFSTASPAFRLGAAVAEFAEVMRMAEFVEEADLGAVEREIADAGRAGGFDTDEVLALVSAARVLLM